MMNLVALGLLLSSLAAAGVFSPHPAEPKLSRNLHQQQQQQQQLHQHDALVREGHRLLVVEYERQFADQPLHAPPPHHASHQLIEDAKDKFQEAAALLPNVGQGVSMPASSESKEPKASHSAKNMICDAYGACKEKISNLVGKGKEMMSEKATELEEGAKEAAKKSAEKAGEVKEAAKDIAKDVAKDAKEKATKLKDGAEDAIKGVVDKVSNVKDDAVDSVKEKALKAKEMAEDAKEKAAHLKEGAMDAMEEVVDSAKQTGEGISDNVSSIAEKAKDKAEKTKKEVRRNLTDILHRARDVAYDAAAYVWAPETGRAAAAIMQLVGFGTAYGTCVWVTFVSSHVLAMALPRQQFGVVQSKLYPVYFRAISYSIALTLLGQFLGGDRKVVAEKVQSYNVLGALVLVLINMLFLEPKATKVMFERMKLEKEEGRGRDMVDVAADASVTASPLQADAAGRAKAAAAEQEAVKSRMVKLSKKLKRLNSYSSLLNVLTLMSLTWHLVHLSLLLQVVNC